MNPATVYRYSTLTLNHFYVLLLLSPAIYVLLRRARANASAALILSAAVPGALAFLALIAVTTAANPNPSVRSILPILILYPASWLLPLISLGQLPRLARSAQPVGTLTYLAAAFAAGLYVLTSAMGLARN